ncbi:YheC/YheD family protein [Thermoactinomyces mirandus]|uniref:YheC/YheD family protein n=1 Tax=Thermoactinomyces mirandus TaxID=2756294 RepID=A0A7W2AR12_9BACL|nr:YheC/YheD family protein [Thermoactinomyces mirandus]MBA4601837.1 YheC/YheD family protein [Thermoactinomyces mirandus]
MALGKMTKHNQMLKHPVLRKYIPETHWHTRKGLFQMLKSYSCVFIKPNHGTGGTGIIRIKRTSNGYQVRYGKRRTVVRNHSFLHRVVQSCQKLSQRYLVQQGLHLAKYNGRIFDIRSYMQKPHSKWVVSGMVARVAAPNHYLTNYHKGGHGEPLDKVLAHLFKSNRRKVNNRLNLIKKLSHMIAKTLNKRYSHICELGIDFVIEKNGRLWILEANTRPGYQLFSHLPDQTMFRKIRKNKCLIRTRHT